MGLSVQNRPSKVCGRQPTKNLKFLEAVFTKFTCSILKYFDPNISKGS